MEKEYIDLLKQSYKKLKSSVYFDKTQLILRDKIVAFETSGHFEQDILEMGKQMLEGKWNELTQPIYNSVSCVAFPKKIKESESKSNDAPLLISNTSSKSVEIDTAQYFIDMDVKGYILGVAWILIVGYLLDNGIYEHSYGNRLRKNLIKENGKPDFSPYLFEPYFQQYESWRDKALNLAKEALNREQDVVVLTLDFKRFFYHVNIGDTQLTEIVERLFNNQTKTEYSDLVKPLTNFVNGIIKNYSLRLEKFESCNNRRVLPIGFAPSNIIANYCLKEFDDAIIAGWNPIYYGRYVDDIIIVDKVEKNSLIYSKACKNELQAEHLINYYLLTNEAWDKRKSFAGQGCDKKDGLLIEHITDTKDNKTEIEYCVNANFVTFHDSNIVVQNKKIKMFYFNANQTDELLDCFQNKLRENNSEFRYLPEDDDVFNSDDYSGLYALKENDSPNKLRGVTNISIDRFNLSKFLGKYMRISTLVKDKKEYKFDSDIDKIFDNVAIIDNYIVWERVISILTYNNKFEAVKQFIKRIADSIKSLSFSKIVQENMKCALRKTLYSAVSRALSLVWGSNVKALIIDLFDICKELGFDGGSTEQEFYKHLLCNRMNYCVSRMCDKYAMSTFIDGYINNNGLKLSDDIDINLVKMSDNLFVKYTFNFWNDSSNTYQYYPYLVTMNDLNLYNLYLELFEAKENIVDIDRHLIDKLKELYIKINFNESNNKNFNIPIYACTNKSNANNMFIKVGNSRQHTVKVAVANVILKDEDFEKVLKGHPNRSYDRYKSLVSIVNQAIANKVDILVMPESFLPIEWLPTLARTCAKNQIAVVTGIEHVKLKNSCGQNVVFNLTATILPFVDEDYKFSFVYFHHKKHFSPDEKETIISYRCRPIEGNSYELFSWNDFWFPVYCCYELASIKDRAIFQSYADSLIAVEWNRDTKYYSNIVESLSRDMHCFCIQVNTAKFGDSRITAPTKSEEKDIVQVKGGINPTILVESLNISELRDFQLKGNELQLRKPTKGRFSFKPTPPDFNFDIVQSKIDGTLWIDIVSGKFVL